MTAAIAEMPAVPTKLKKLTIVLAPELQAAIEAYALRSKRSQSNAASILLEQALIVTGDLPEQIERKESRGGTRANAGRPKASPADAAQDDARSAISPEPATDDQG
jgi:hypothetical protein